MTDGNRHNRHDRRDRRDRRDRHDRRELHAAVDAYVREHTGAMVDLLRRLVRCRPEYVGDRDGIARAQRLLHAELAGQGVPAWFPRPDPVVVEADPLYVPVADWSAEFADYRPCRDPLLIAATPPRPGTATLALAGHVDVEPVAAHLWADPAAVDGAVHDGHVYGRGTADMLGGLVSMITGWAAARQATELAVNVQLHCVPDEELGGNGTLALLHAVGAPEYVLVAEPTSMRACVATLGFHHFRVDVPGPQQHIAATSETETAVERTAEVITRLRAARAELAARIVHAPGFAGYEANPLALGIVRGGTDAAVPPPVVRLEGAAFSAPGMSAADTVAVLNAALPRWARVRPGGLSFNGNAPAADDRLAVALLDTLGDAGLPAAAAGFPSPCDLRLYLAHGAAGVVCGPGDLDRAHGPDERIAIHRLVDHARIVGRLLVDFDPHGEEGGAR